MSSAPCPAVGTFLRRVARCYALQVTHTEPLPGTDGVFVGCTRWGLDRNTGRHIKVRAHHYVRYVDDFVLLHQSPAWLVDAHRRIREFLPARLGAHLNDSKTVLQPVARGIDFVGHVIKPWRRSTRKRTVATAIQRLATMPASETFAAGNSYLGLIGQASHSHHDRARIANTLRDRGHAVAGDLSKIYRRAT